MKCKTCGIEGNEFYVSNKNHCKECIKASVRANRLKNMEYYREYDRQRANDPERVKARQEYTQTESYKIAHLKANQKYRQNDKTKYTSNGVFSAAIRDGLLFREPCLICGNSEAQGHHFDYRFPLNVVWLCDEHHKHAHKVANEISRQMSVLSANDTFTSDIIATPKVMKRKDYGALPL